MFTNEELDDLWTVLNNDIRRLSENYQSFINDGYHIKAEKADERRKKLISLQYKIAKMTELLNSLEK